jgi:hypothetical protein
MDTGYRDAAIGDSSLNASLHLMQSRTRGSISGGNGASGSLHEKYPGASPGIDGSTGSGTGVEGKVSLDSENEHDLFASDLKKLETERRDSKKENLPSEPDSPFMASFLIDLIHSIKSALASISNASLFSLESMDSPETRKRSHAQVKEDIKRIDSVLNSLLNFINVNTPIAKTDTLYTILEEVLETQEKPLREKNIEIIKRYVNGLPETYIHNEQLRFILHSILQYAIVSTPPNETIVVSVKSLDAQGKKGIQKPSVIEKSGYIEAIVGFNKNGNSGNSSEKGTAERGGQRGDSIDLILVLVKEILERNNGIMAVGTNGKKPNTLIGLRFPIERRKVVYYEPITF